MNAKSFSLHLSKCIPALFCYGEVAKSRDSLHIKILLWGITNYYLWIIKNGATNYILCPKTDYWAYFCQSVTAQRFRSFAKIPGACYPSSTATRTQNLLANFVGSHQEVLPPFPTLLSDDQEADDHRMCLWSIFHIYFSGASVSSYIIKALYKATTRTQSPPPIKSWVMMRSHRCLVISPPCWWMPW